MKIHYRLRSFLIIASSSLLSNSRIHAATGTWNVDANGLWSLNTNWASSIIADDLLSTANFTNNITADRTVSLDSDRTINRVNFSDSDTSSAGSWILDNNGTATNNLILSGTTGAASGTVPVIDVGALGTGKTATISAVIEGSYGFTKTSGGTLTLTGNNTLTGAVTIAANGGTVSAGHNNALGTASVSINSNTQLVIQDGIAINNALTATNQGNFKGLALLSGATSATYSGTISILETSFLNFDINVATGGTLTISGIISGQSFEKVGAGTVILTGANNYDLTTITTGIVDFANKAAKPAGTATAGVNGSVGLGVKASDAAYYSATDVGNLFNTNTLTGFSLNAASGVAIDTTNAGADFDQTVALTAARALTKLGTGTLILSQTNTYSGATTVSGGKLVVNGNISTSTLTTVAVGATLGGSGTVGKAIINGTLAVGNSPGTMIFTDTLGLNGITEMEIDGTAGAGVTGGHDFTNLTGAGAAGVLTYGGTMTLDIGVIFAVGSYSWDLFNMASETGTFTSIALSDQYSGSLVNTLGVWGLTSGSNTWQFTESTGVLGLTVVPEPNVAALLGGLGTLVLLRRRR